MKDLRGPLPLTDADFTRIRANVIARVRPRRGVFALRWAFAVVAAAFVGLFSYKPLVTIPVAPPAPPPVAVAAPAPVTVELPAPVTAPAPPRVAHRRAVTPKPTNQLINQPTAQPTFRMEIQTADPDIRIIWLPAKSEEQS